MSRLVIVTGKVNPFGGAVAKASLIRAFLSSVNVPSVSSLFGGARGTSGSQGLEKSVVIDAKRDDLPLARMKPQ